MKNIFFLSFFLFFQSILFSQDRNSVVICWDSSISISTSEIESNIAVLKEYFFQHPNVDVELIVFSNTVQLRETHQILDGEWSNLQTSLAEVIYDGGTSYDFLTDAKIESDEVLIFTDGLENLSETTFNIDSSVKIYCGSKNCVRTLLTKVGPFVNIINTDSRSSSTTKFLQERRTVKGYVLNEYGALSDALVFNKTTGEKATTSIVGEYILNVDSEDIIQIQVEGYQPFERRARDISKQLTLEVNENNLLNEVIIKGEKLETENLVLIGDRTVDKKKLGYDVKTIDADDIASTNNNLGTAIKGKVAGVHVGYNNDISATIIRGYNSFLGNSHPLMIIDGVTLPRSQLDIDARGTVSGGGALDVIDPNNIKSISVLKGLAATNRYGAEGNSGVILITTKTGSFSKNEEKSDQILGTTRTYDGTTTTNSADFHDDFFNKVKDAKNIEVAYDIYLSERAGRKDDYEFYLAAARYFKDWNNPILTRRILSNSVEVANDDTDALRSIVFVYEEFGFYDSGIAILINLLKKDEKSVQTLRNLALSYERNGEIEKSFEKHLDVQKIVNEYPAKYFGLEETLTAEFKSFVTRNKSKLELSTVDPIFRKSFSLYKRVVFEWNKTGAQFSLQIVNPQNRYHTWSHTDREEPTRLKKEKDQDYRLEEFFLTISDSGKWIFNLENLGNITDSKDSLYFKISVYTNFGTINESIVTKVVKMTELNNSINVLNLKI